MSFKEKAINALRTLKENRGPNENTVVNYDDMVDYCIDILEEIPEEKHCGEKTCGINWEAKCKELDNQLMEAQCMLDSLKLENQGMLRRIEYLSGYQCAVELLCGGKNRRTNDSKDYVAIPRNL